MAKGLMSLEEVSEYLDWSEDTIKELIAAEELLGVRIDDDWFFSRLLIDRWVEKFVERFKWQILEKNALESGRFKKKWWEGKRLSLKHKRKQLKNLREKAREGRGLGFQIQRLKELEKGIKNWDIVKDDPDIMTKYTKERKALEKTKSKLCDKTERLDKEIDELENVLRMLK